MTTQDQRDQPKTPSALEPYAMVGAGRLVSTIWKLGDEQHGWRYRFNLLRLSPGGHAGNRLRPQDVLSLVRLAKVLAAELASDGCLDAAQRSELTRLAAALDHIIPLKD